MWTADVMISSWLSSLLRLHLMPIWHPYRSSSHVTHWNLCCSFIYIHTIHTHGYVLSVDLKVGLLFFVFLWLYRNIYNLIVIIALGELCLKGSQRRWREDKWINCEFVSGSGWAARNDDSQACAFKLLKQLASKRMACSSFWSQWYLKWSFDVCMYGENTTSPSVICVITSTSFGCTAVLFLLCDLMRL